MTYVYEECAGDDNENEEEEEELFLYNHVRGGGNRHSYSYSHSGDTSISKKKRKRIVYVVTLFAIVTISAAIAIAIAIAIGATTFLHDFSRNSPASTEQPTEPTEIFDPQIAWLASFPNSGTSFTLTMVARATNTSFATNYGIEAKYGVRDGTPSLSIYGPNHPEGPFMPDPVTSFHHRQLPYGKYVITKTHCGGYCFNCGPKEYAYGYNGNDNGNDGTAGILTNETATALATAPIAIASQLVIPQPPPLSFLQDCASGHAVDQNGDLIDVSYPPERVSRVIHLIRNPFHNVIARYHLERKHHRDANTTKDQQWLIEHPDNGTGMSLFCQELDRMKRRGDEEIDFFLSDHFLKKNADADAEGQEEVVSFKRRNGGGDHHDATTTSGPPSSTSSSDWKNIISNVPCRGDFFRYVQWHNLLHESLDYLPYKLPVLTVYYEDYQPPQFMDTAQSILEFLDLEAVAGDKRGNVKWAEFVSHTDYETFFTSEQKEYIELFLSEISSYQVWGEIQHYF
ncbi:hypothetical protein FRACYDRAFT_246411 [Fragilariopsis cylindrus CCMP1102]|uniref:Sulfotransferase domain-containing protein n=1 Tax=Fragilariopsis cylindrus CCMP1102 TaxID=635003 RepID=A0A1E7EZK4_9STRA|nr:hypothetical protein FRACYDRAFT_246411 [Fragilariopsis cylindrus CCMP1102]|eukprot:OEU11297.1 hypothetical protein FRACYDRAFT_246411 [Fragilariopsis cylindrus CCMP1102]